MKKFIIVFSAIAAVFGIASVAVLLSLKKDLDDFCDLADESDDFFADF